MSSKMFNHISLINLSSCHERSLFHWVNVMFNKVSESRMEEVGPDRACAEWLLRNGARVQWKGMKYFTTDYNELPLNEGKTAGSQFHIHAVDATDSSIMVHGFPHFKGCHYIERMLLKRCNLLGDDALPALDVLEKSLTTLEISSCGNFSDEGLLSLINLRNLKLLKLQDLVAVKNKEGVLKQLQGGLPSCRVTFDQADEVAVEKM